MIKYPLYIIVYALIISGVALADTVNLYPTGDAGIQQYAPDTNFGDSIYGFAGTYDGGYLRSLFLFNLSPYIGNTVNHAYLEIYIDDHYGTWPTPDMRIARVTASWDEGTVTWNNQPGNTQNIGASIPQDGWWSIDATGFGQGWVGGSYDNYGLILMSATTGNNNYLRLLTKENDGTTIDPRLELDYSSSSIETSSLGEIKAIYK